MNRKQLLKSAGVYDYELKTPDGKHIRIASKVIFPDGIIVKFTEKMPKFEAITQALEYRKKQKSIERILVD